MIDFKMVSIKRIRLEVFLSQGLHLKGTLGFRTLVAECDSARQAVKGLERSSSSAVADLVKFGCSLMFLLWNTSSSKVPPGPK
jgi:hypothetical protein